MAIMFRRPQWFRRRPPCLQRKRPPSGRPVWFALMAPYFVASLLFILLDFFVFLVVFLLILSFDMSPPLLMVSPAAGAVVVWAKAVEERKAEERKAEERKAKAVVAMISLRIR